MQGLPRFLSDGAGKFCSCILFFVLPTPPHSALGHGLGIRAANVRHGTVGFSCSFSFSSCRRPPQPRAGGRPGKSAYSHCGAGPYVRSLSLCDACYFVFSLLCVFSSAFPPPSRDCGLCHLSSSVCFSFFVLYRPLATIAACGRVQMLVSLS